MAHIPVLLNEVLEMLDPRKGCFVIDGTTDGGGHAEAILERMGSEGKFLAIDWDRDVLERTKARIAAAEKKRGSRIDIRWANDNYANAAEILESEKLGRADGFLLDLGFSTEQLESIKGFSFKKPQEPLDMRYEQKEGNPTAAEAVNSLKEEDLANIIFQYGEERFARRIAKAIVDKRREERIITVGDLVNTVKGAVPGFFKKGEGDVVARVFQAIRIYINRELENVEIALRNLPKVLASGGRVAIITFHSLEDRIVKNRFREMEKEGILKIINKKPIEPTEAEVKENPKSRSAKLRGAILI